MPALLALLTLGNETLLFLFRAGFLRTRFTQRYKLGQSLFLVDLGKLCLDFRKQRVDAHRVTSHIVITVTGRCSYIDTCAAGRHGADTDRKVIAKSENERLMGGLDQAHLIFARRHFRNNVPVHVLHRVTNRAEGRVCRAVDRQGLKIRISFC
ncbi:MAG TPA: hypothetical protein VKA94_00545, partial [Hyphomicrobiales bacterium]|nr:hypothetical protein [Hyphomicrobiales bacterium]